MLGRRIVLSVRRQRPTKARTKQPVTRAADIIRTMLAKYPEAATAEIKQRVLEKYGIVVSRQSVQYARQVPTPKATGRPRKNTKCPKCGHEFHARLDV